jgi:tRNA 5-methylaminomethyl-2-thiouridine biosynthesis bifunctional protein
MSIFGEDSTVTTTLGVGAPSQRDAEIHPEINPPIHFSMTVVSPGLARTPTTPWEMYHQANKVSISIELAELLPDWIRGRFEQILVYEQHRPMCRDLPKWLARHAAPGARLVLEPSVYGEISPQAWAAAQWLEDSNGVSTHSPKVMLRMLPVDRRPPQKSRRRIHVVGAGVMGHVMMASLARLPASAHQATLHWWDIDPKPGALAGSTQPVLAEHPHLSFDENPLTHLTWWAHHRLAELPQRGLTRTPRLQHADSASDWQQMIQTAAALGARYGQVQAWNPDQVESAMGYRPKHGALWWPETFLAQTPVWFETLRAHARCEPAGISLDALQGMMAPSLESHSAPEDIWILACGHRLPEVLALWPQLKLAYALPVHQVAGASVQVPESSVTPMVLGGAAYRAPLAHGHALVGSTYCDPADIDHIDHRASNLQRLARMTGQAPGDLHTDGARLGEFRGLRLSTADRLPLIGPCPDPRSASLQWARLHRNDRLALPHLAGVWLASGAGSRGLLWAALAGSVVSHQVMGWPAPLPGPLLDAIAPQRFLKKKIRRSASPS